MMASSTHPVPPRQEYPLLQNGDRLDQPTFHALYQQAPKGFHAELIGGIVCVASPVSIRHGIPQLTLASWLAWYTEDTPGVQGFDNTTMILGPDSELQPDLALRIKPDFGGQSTDSPESIIIGPCELVIEISHSTASLDTNIKKKAYEAAGVREYLIVLTRTQSVIWYTRNASGFVEMRPSTAGVLQSQVFPGLWLQATAVFDETAKRLRLTLERGLASSEHAAFVQQLANQHAVAPTPNTPLHPGDSQ
ncbi:MAG: Uma2 family endonuclease [Bacteroidales bacterium]|nr:Uma2 family endonuclease [Bacteroidales bacterium]